MGIFRRTSTVAGLVPGAGYRLDTIGDAGESGVALRAGQHVVTARKDVPAPARPGQGLAAGDQAGASGQERQ